MKPLEIMPYVISIIVIIGGMGWIFNAGGYFVNKGKSMDVKLTVVIILMVIGIVSIIGGLRLWP